MKKCRARWAGLFVLSLTCFQAFCDTMDFKTKTSVSNGDTVIHLANVPGPRSYYGMTQGMGVQVGSNISFVPVAIPGNVFAPGTSVTATANSTTDTLGLQTVAVTSPSKGGTSYTIDSSDCTCWSLGAGVTFRQPYVPTSGMDALLVDAQTTIVGSGSSCDPSSASWSSQTGQNLAISFMPGQRVCAALRVTQQVGMGSQEWQTVQTTRYPYCDCDYFGVGTSGYSP